MRDLRLRPGIAGNDIVLVRGEPEADDLRLYAGITGNDVVLRRMLWSLAAAGTDRRAQVSWAEFEVPDAPAGAGPPLGSLCTVGAGR